MNKIISLQKNSLAFVLRRSIGTDAPKSFQQQKQVAISDILKISKNENRDLTSLIIDSAKNTTELEQLIRDFSIFS